MRGSVRVRPFSTSSVEYAQERFPYIFGNNLSSLVKTRPTTKPVHLAAVNSFVTSEKYNINVGFFLAYKCFLESLASGDRETLKDICEGQLYLKFSEALDLLDQKNLRLKLLNAHRNKKPHLSGSLTLVDFHNFAGVRIDRQVNRASGLREVSPFFVNLPNISVYMPSNPFKMSAGFLDPTTQGKGLKMDSLTMELLVAIKSSLKLDLVDLSPDEGQRPNFLTESKLNDDEIHFVKFEGRLPTIEMTPASIKNLDIGLGKLV